MPEGDISEDVLQETSTMRTLDSLSSHEFAALLLCSGHAKYATLCLNTPLSGQDFLNCSESDLEEIGITFVRTASRFWPW